MDKWRIKNLRKLIEAAAAEYGNKTFIKERCGSGVSEKSYA